MVQRGRNLVYMAGGSCVPGARVHGDDIERAVLRRGEKGEPLLGEEKMERS
jgi:hypothetical protein